MNAGRPHSLIATLGLMAHPEGGYYREVHRSGAVVKPSDGRDPRPALTTIYFLLTRGQISRWHRVRSEEVWHFYEGSPLELCLASSETSSVDVRRLGPVENGQQPVIVVPADCWQAARATGEYTLVGCTVAPGFEFRDFALAHDQPAIAAAFRSRGGIYAELL
jgi:uncharacterized protein